MPALYIAFIFFNNGFYMYNIIRLRSDYVYNIVRLQRNYRWASVSQKNSLTIINELLAGDFNARIMVQGGIITRSRAT